MKKNKINNEKLQGINFNNKLWRKILTEIVKKIDIDNIGIEIISPFGFELFEEKSFLSKNLCRLYCYIGLPVKGNIEREYFSSKFDSMLFEKIREIDIDFYNKIVIKIIQDKFIYLRPADYECKKTDKLIDIQYRYFKESMLTDYSDYLICTLTAINDSKDEPKNFYENKRFRNRTYQLYVMLEKIFGHLIPSMTDGEQSLYKIIISRITNSVDIFFNESKLFESSDIVDDDAMNNLIRPRVSKIIDRLKISNDILSIKSESYHVSDSLEISIGREYYEDALKKIKFTYNNFI